MTAPPKKRSRTARVTRRTAGTLLGVVLVAALGVLFLLRTALGHRTVLSWGIGQLEARVAGSVEVGAVRSASLLRGARLVGVRLTTPDGTPFVVADSLEASYSLSGLLRGDLVFDGIRVWSPRVTLRRDSTGTDTFARWLRGDAPPSDGGGGGPSLRLDGLRVFDGALALRLSADGRDAGGPMRVERDGDDIAWRAIDVTDLDAQIGRVQVSPDAGIEVYIGQASATVDALERPFPVEGLRGDVRVLDGGVAVNVRDLRAPGIDASGTVEVDLRADGGPVTVIDARLPEADLEPWSWLAESVPPLSGSLRLEGRLGPEGQRWSAAEVDARWSGGRVRGRGAVELAGGVRFDAVDLAVDDLPVSALADYLPRRPEAEGRLTGTVALEGAPSALQLDGAVTLAVDSGGPVAATFAGGVLVRETGVGFDAFRARLEPLDYGVVGRFVPSVRLTGTGWATLDASGTLADGLALSADVRHVAVGGAESQVKVEGNLIDAGEDRIRVDVQGDLSPLSLDALARDFAELPVRGSVVGPWRARGLLRDLEVRADLITPEGRVELSGVADVREPGRRYRLEANVVDFRASALTPSLPDPSFLTGTLRVDGQGLDPATLEATASVDLPRGDVRGVGIDSLRATGRVSGGVLTLDTITARVAGLAIDGEGTLAADVSRPAGAVQLSFEAADLTGVRAIFRGDTVLTADDLTPLDRDVLTLQGVDPDTLPLAEEVVAEGRVRGEATLTGAVGDFAVTGWMEGEEIRYGDSRLRAARLELVADGLPGLAGQLHAKLEVDSAEVVDRTFTGGTFEVDYRQPQGSAVVRLVRDTTEDYRLAGRFELDSLGGTLDVDEATLRIDTLRYRTTHPTRVTWSDEALEVDSLSIVGEGSDAVSIRAGGVLPRRGSADFALDVRGLALERLARVAQREDLGLAGTVDVSGRLAGTAASPRFSGEIEAAGLEARSLSLERVAGTVEYAGLEVDVGLDAWSGDLRVLRVEGQWPFSWSLDGSSRDVGDQPVALDLRADSLPAGLVLALLEDLEDTRGTVSGSLRVGGTPSALRPEGRVRLDDGAWTVGALGARQESVQATFDVRPDRTVQVAASGRSGGTVDVAGTITLDSLASPALDLDIRLAAFNAVNRRDIAGAVSGELELQGRYGRPRVLGSLQVDRGDLYLDEFARNVGVVDLSDPRFAPYFDQDLLASRPLLAETRNPFMDNLLVSIDLAVARNTWLRSTQLNVEMQGDLLVTYDRPSRDVVLIGQLAAVRGQYQFLGQNFEVQGGEVEFVGIAGINPNLSIQASTQVRRRAGDPLTIDAEVVGTLIEPRVLLSTSDAAVSESDILSYIAVGQPASSITSQFGSTLLGGGVSLIGGTLTSSLSSLAQSSGWIDFLAISQAVDASALGANAQSIGNSFAGTQVEVGRYFGGGDYFAAVMFRPLTSAGGTGSLLGGARLEWQASEQYHLELFAEDRFLRTGSFGFRELGFESTLIYGFTLYREWGY